MCCTLCAEYGQGMKKSADAAAIQASNIKQAGSSKLKKDRTRGGVRKRILHPLTSGVGSLVGIALAEVPDEQGGSVHCLSVASMPSPTLPLRQ